MSAPDFVDLATPSLPPWLAEAVDAIKFAAGVTSILGRDVEELRRQVCAFVRRPLHEDEGLPAEVYEQLKNCIAKNDALEKKGLSRQSVFSLIGNGKWREAPKRRMEKAGKDDAYVPNPERDQQERADYIKQVDADLWRKAFYDMLQNQCASTVDAHRDAARAKFQERVLRSGGELAAVMAPVVTPPQPTLAKLSALIEGL